MKHHLKIEENYLKNLMNRTKKSEIRINDRDYQRDDILEYTLCDEFLKCTTYKFAITHIHSGLGLKENYVVLSVEYVKSKEGS